MSNKDEPRQIKGSIPYGSIKTPDVTSEEKKEQTPPSEGEKSPSSPPKSETGKKSE